MEHHNGWLTDVADRNGRPLGDGDGTGGPDRRRPAAGPRHSWASTQPFREPTASEPTLPTRSLGMDGVPRWRRRVVGRYLALDAVLAATVGALSALWLTPADSPGAVLALGILSALGWTAVLALHRAYDVRRTGAGPDELQAVMQAGVLVAAGIAVLSYATTLAVPRTVVFLSVPVLTVATALARYVVRRGLHRRRARQTDGFRTVVVGRAADIVDTRRRLEAERHHGYQVAGVCLPAFEGEDGLAGLPVLGAIADIPQVVVDHAIDVVLVVGDELSGEPLRRLSWALERTRAELVVAPGLIEVTGPRVAVRPTAGLSLLHLEPPTRHVGRRLGKAAVDRGLGLAMLVAVLPLLLVAGLAVVVTSPGGAFYRQTRVGLDGRHFTIYKLRTMRQDAGLLRDALLDLNDGDGVRFKMRRDPRITRVGAFLRRYSVDELPQLFNVVKGDMSLVGPRPPLPEEVDVYMDHVYRRLHVRPGLTGLWQVSGRSDLTWDESVRLDLRYVDNWSLAFDLMILWKTGAAVIRGSGAY